MGVCTQGEKRTQMKAALPEDETGRMPERTKQQRYQIQCLLPVEDKEKGKQLDPCRTDPRMIEKRKRAVQ